MESTRKAETKPPNIPFPKKIEACWVFQDTIDRIFQLLSDVHNIEQLNMKTQLPYMFTDHPTPLNSFEYTILEISSMAHSKIVEWLISSKDICVDIKQSFNLNQNTLDNSTLFTFTISIIHPEKIPHQKHQKVIKGCKKICVEMINNVDILIQSSKDYIYEIETGIIKANRKIVWDYLTNPDGFDIDRFADIKFIEGYKIEVGTVFSVTLKDSKAGVSNVKIKIEAIEDDVNMKKMVFVLSPIDAPYEIQTLKFTLIEIGENETLLSLKHKFGNQIKKEDLKVLEKEKINLIKHIKRKLENVENKKG